MTLTREQIAALKAAAESAQAAIRPGYQWGNMVRWGMIRGSDPHEAFAALCTPETILALLADRETVEKPISAFRPVLFMKISAELDRQNIRRGGNVLEHCLTDVVLALLADRDAGEGECPWEFDLDRPCPKHGLSLLECPSPPQVPYGRVAAMLAPPTPGAEEVAAAREMLAGIMLTLWVDLNEDRERRMPSEKWTKMAAESLTKRLAAARTRGFAEGVIAGRAEREARQ